MHHDSDGSVLYQLMLFLRMCGSRCYITLPTHLSALYNSPKMPTHLFFRYNTALGPPYRIIVDTNFLNFSIQNKLDPFISFMDCLLAKCIPMITDCVMAELEKLGTKYRIALRLAKDPRFERLPCTHKGTYADDCIVTRVSQHKCYVVATCDKDLKRRIRKVPGKTNHKQNTARNSKQ